MIDPNEKEIVSSRTKASLYLLGNLAFVGITVFVPDDESSSGNWRIWFSLLFGLGVLVFAWLLIRPLRLKLDAQGFTRSGGFIRVPKSINWHEIGPLFLLGLPRGGKVICYNFNSEARTGTAWLNLNRHFGADGSLPNLWPVGADKLSDEMNDYRLRALANR